MNNWRLLFQRNNGQSTGPAGVDLNVEPAWAQGYNGKGVVVSVLDDGEWTCFVVVVVVVGVSLPIVTFIVK